MGLLWVFQPNYACFECFRPIILLWVIQPNYLALSVSAQLCLHGVFQPNYVCFKCFNPIIFLSVFQPNYFAVSFSGQLFCSECFSPIMLAWNVLVQIFCCGCFRPITLLSMFQPNYVCSSVSAQLCLLWIFQPNYRCSECFNPIMFSLHTIIINSNINSSLLFNSLTDALPISVVTYIARSGRIKVTKDFSVFTENKFIRRSSKYRHRIPTWGASIEPGYSHSIYLMPSILELHSHNDL